MTATGSNSSTKALRWTIISHKPFDAVVAAAETGIGKPNMSERL
jgi:hypothetical protein